MKTTLNKIRNQSPCESGWKTLLQYLGKTKADDDPLSFETILKAVGIKDAVWCLRTLPLKETTMFTSEVVEAVLPIFESKFPEDKRPRETLEALKGFSEGKVSQEELRNVTYAASAAYADAYDAAKAAYAAYDASAAAYAYASVNAASAAKAAAAAAAAYIVAEAAADAAADAAYAADAAAYAADAAADAAAAYAARLEFWNTTVTELFKKHFC